MYCRHCGYALYGLMDRRCPECGGGFNAHDPATFATSPERLARPPLWPLVVTVFYPIVTIVLVWSAWAAARSALGHAPQPAQEPATALTGRAGVCCTAARFAVLGFVVYVPLFPLGLIGYLLFGRGSARLRRTLVLLLSYTALVAGSFVFIRSHATAVEWLMG